MAAVHAEDEALDPPASRPAKPRTTNRGSLPKHLPRIEEVIEPDSTICGCGGERHVISEDISERLDIIPAQFRVIRCPAAHVYMRERGHAPPEICL
jgi:transposase